MRIQPKFIATQAILLTEELIAEKGDRLVIADNDAIAVLSNEDYQLLYQTIDSKPPAIQAPRHRMPGRCNLRTDRGRILDTFMDAAGVLTTNLSITMVFKLTGVPITHISAHLNKLVERKWLQSSGTHHSRVFNLTQAGKAQILTMRKNA